MDNQTRILGQIAVLLHSEFKDTKKASHSTLKNKIDGEMAAYKDDEGNIQKEPVGTGNVQVRYRGEGAEELIAQRGEMAKYLSDHAALSQLSADRNEEVEKARMEKNRREESLLGICLTEFEEKYDVGARGGGEGTHYDLTCDDDEDSAPSSGTDRRRKSGSAKRARGARAGDTVFKSSSMGSFQVGDVESDEYIKDLMQEARDHDKSRAREDDARAERRAREDDARAERQADLLARSITQAIGVTTAVASSRTEPTAPAQQTGMSAFQKVAAFRQALVDLEGLKDLISEEEYIMEENNIYREFGFHKNEREKDGKFLRRES